mgnify:FL=1
MNPIDIPAIEEVANELRTAEIHRINHELAERAGQLTKLAIDSSFAGLHIFSEMLRPLFSWNPQDHSAPPAKHIGPAIERANEAARALFSWNPQDRRS